MPTPPTPKLPAHTLAQLTILSAIADDLERMVADPAQPLGIGAHQVGVNAYNLRGVIAALREAPTVKRGRPAKET